MRFATPLRKGVLLRRWQRFLAEVALENGGPTVVHVPNSGRLTGVAVFGSPVWVAPTRDGRLPFRLEIVDTKGVLVGVNTLKASALAEEALRNGVLSLPKLLPDFVVRREVSPLPGVRLDLLLRDPEGPYWVEVKNITLVEEGVGLFPDAVTKRGSKHLRVLADLARQGIRAAVVYVVQREDAKKVTAAASIDPTYAREMTAAMEAGVEFVAVGCKVSPEAIMPTWKLPVKETRSF